MMTYGEFETIVKNIGLVFVELDVIVCVRDREGNDLISIYKDSILRMDSQTMFMGILSDRTKHILFNASVELTKTPPEKRGERKKYRLKFAGDINDFREYLNVDRETGRKYFNDGTNTETTQTEFSEEELKRIDETGLVREPV